MTNVLGITFDKYLFVATGDQCIKNLDLENTTISFFFYFANRSVNVSVKNIRPFANLCIS